LLLLATLTLMPRLVPPTAAGPVVIRAASEANPPCRLEQIRAGAVIEGNAPPGWTHLILKSQPRLRDSDHKLVSGYLVYHAQLFFTAMAAEVRAAPAAGGRRHYLARLGVGTGTAVGGRSVIVTPETQAGLGANLGLSASLVLSEMCAKQQESRLVAVSATAAVLDTPAIMPGGNGHQPVIIRYAVVVEPVTGRLDTLAWRIDRDERGTYAGAVGMMEWLPPAKLVDAELQVDLREFTLGIPTERTFAVLRIPDGQRRFAIPPGLRDAAGAARPTPEMARTLEAGLRELIRTR
jgi:hypothetical protein